MSDCKDFPCYLIPIWLENPKTADETAEVRVRCKHCPDYVPDPATLADAAYHARQDRAAVEVARGD